MIFYSLTFYINVLFYMKKIYLRNNNVQNIISCENIND